MNRVLTKRNHHLSAIYLQNKHVISTAARNAAFTSSRHKSSSTLPEGTQIQILGGHDDFDSLKRYILVRTPTTTEAETQVKDNQNNPVNHLASLYAKRNIIFGTKLHDAKIPYREACRPLLDMALQNASTYGDQPQGLANLDGLSAYVRRHLHLLERSGGDDGASPALTKLRPVDEEEEEKKVVYDAVRAVATQIPREGHSVVGFGTYRDARSGWSELAREYATLEDGDVDGEASFFRESNGVFANVEYNGDSDEKYLRMAGGAMARFFFL